MQGEPPSTAGLPPQGFPREPFDAAEPQRQASYGTLRLQPVLLGPPPENDAVDVTSADDLDPSEFRGHPKTGLIAGIIAGIAVLSTAGAAYWTLRPVDDLPPMAAPALPGPTQAGPTQAGPTQAGLAQIPAPVSASPISTAPAVAFGPAAAPGLPAPAGQLDMARIDSDLVPPATDGLSPARRIATIRIMVENDREVASPR
jgi:hypothetical protein